MKPQAARVLGVFGSGARAELAVKSLRLAGFEATRLSVIGKQEHGPRFWRRLGAALAPVAIVPLALAGRAVAVGRIGACCDAVGADHASALTAMLMRAGMSAGAARTYVDAVRGGQIVVLVHGGAQDVLKARRVIFAGAR